MWSAGVNSFILSLSDDAADADTCLYEALKHCRQLGVLAVVSADTQSSFTALVSSVSYFIYDLDLNYTSKYVYISRTFSCKCCHNTCMLLLLLMCGAESC